MVGAAGPVDARAVRPNSVATTTTVSFHSGPRPESAVEHRVHVGQAGGELARAAPWLAWVSKPSRDMAATWGRRARA